MEKILFNWPIIQKKKTATLPWALAMCGCLAVHPPVWPASVKWECEKKMNKKKGFENRLTTLVPAESPSQPLAMLGPMWWKIAWQQSIQPHQRTKICNFAFFPTCRETTRSESWPQPSRFQPSFFRRQRELSCYMAPPSLAVGTETTWIKNSFQKHSELNQS